MTDLYTQIANNPLGRLVVKNAGLPTPVPLDRYTPGDPIIRGRVLLGGAPGGRIVANLAKALHERGGGRGVISICAAGGQGVVAILEAA